MKFDLLEENSPVLDLAKHDPDVAKIINDNALTLTKQDADIESLDSEERRPPTKAELVQVKRELRNMPQVHELTDEIDISDPTTIFNFGNKAGSEIEAISDQLLRNAKSIKSYEVTEMMDRLTKVMKSFNTGDFDVDALQGKKGFFNKWKEKTRCSAMDFISKYDNMAKDVDSIAIQLRRYLGDIMNTNRDLNMMYEGNQQAFQLLEMYVVACDLGLEEFDAKKREFENDRDMSEDRKQFCIKLLEDNRNLLEQRQADLKSVELVSQQMMETIRTQMRTNYQLTCKINTSFIITLPIFKQGIILALDAKRQEIQAKSIQELEDVTNAIYLQNAKTTMQTAKTLAKSVNTTVIKIDKAEAVHNIILDGIADVEKTTQEAQAKRAEDMKRMDVMIAEMKKRGHGVNAGS